MAPQSELPPLTPDHWQRLETIFHAATAMPREDRPAFLRGRCGDDQALFDELARMLDSFESERQILPAAAKSSRSGALLGDYRIETELGHGGMGTVYLAHRADGHFEQRVALKILGAHLRSQFFTERFRTERQILAQLNHPNITRLLDGGISAEGDPFLVMEYVDGAPIHRYCDLRMLGIGERIGLFLQVCSAVEYAHRNLIVHRDLKPGNIFVTGDGVPKLFDFGTAKLLLLDERDSTTTRFRMMTPRYASPEQLRGEPVTTLADVYSLGILLYELLTGAWPFGDPDSPMAGLERVVRNLEPARPSSVISEEAARLRGESRAKLARLLDGDLRRVLNKAIEIEPRRRYTSVEHFSEDLRRSLDGQPVLARPQTFFYRASRFAARNRWRLAAGLTIGAGLGLLAFSDLQQRARSEQRMTQVRDLSQSYLTDILSEVGKLPGSMKARLLIVDRARRNLDRLLPDAPRDAELRRALARSLSEARRYSGPAVHGESRRYGWRAGELSQGGNACGEGRSEGLGTAFDAGAGAAHDRADRCPRGPLCGGSGAAAIGARTGAFTRPECPGGLPGGRQSGGGASGGGELDARLRDDQTERLFDRDAARKL